MTAEKLMLIGGISCFVITLIWVRNRELQERYAVIWLILASILLIFGIRPEIILGFADYMNLSYTAAFLLFALTTIYIFSFTIFLSLSRQNGHSIRLAQEVALLESRIRKLENQK